MSLLERRAISLSRKILLLDGTVQNFVAFPTKRDQVSLQILSKSTSPSQVVNIEILEAATNLTAPVIALQDFFTQPWIWDGRHSDTASFLRNKVAHVGLSVGSDGLRVTAEQPMDAEDLWLFMELSLSNAAPAKKSAQIISSE
jgi:hypothetical protein